MRKDQEWGESPNKPTAVALLSRGGWIGARLTETELARIQEAAYSMGPMTCEEMAENILGPSLPVITYAIGTPLDDADAASLERRAVLCMRLATEIREGRTR